MDQDHRVFLIAAPTGVTRPPIDVPWRLIAEGHAALHIGMFLEPRMGMPFLTDHLRDELLEQCRAGVERDAQELRSSGMNVTSETLWSPDPCREILDRVATLKADLVIKNIHHEATLRRVFVTAAGLSPADGLPGSVASGGRSD